MDRITLSSYAKINLTLEVSCKRPDGFHEIDSVVQVIDLCDEITIQRAISGEIIVTADAPGVPSGPQNTVYRACDEFFVATGIREGIRCDIKKRIPAQAGLGGGSGNAASAIIALNRLFERNLSNEEMAKIAAKVGSDAPLFIYGGTVRMRGRGEIIEPLPDAPALDLVIVKPKTGVSTAWAYSELDRIGERKLSDASDICAEAILSQDKAALIERITNDFDAPVSSANAEILSAKSALISAGARAAMLSGSGSAVFGIFESKQAAIAAAGNLTGDFAQIFTARSLPREQGRYE